MLKGVNTFYYFIYNYYRMMDKITLSEIIYYIESVLSFFDLKKYIFNVPCKEPLHIER